MCKDTPSVPGDWWECLGDDVRPLVSVLAEHINYLRGQLETKQVWYQELLQAEKQRVKELEVLLAETTAFRDKLRIALAQAVQSAYAGEIPSDNLDDWDKLVVNG